MHLFASQSVSSTSSSVPRRTRVLCVDDRPDSTWVLRSILEREPDMHCVACIASCDRLVKDVRAWDPEVVVLDAHMPGKDPFVAISELAAELPRVKTIVYSGNDDQAFIDYAMKAGAWGCASKADTTESFLRILREVLLLNCPPSSYNI